MPQERVRGHSCRTILILRRVCPINVMGGCRAALVVAATVLLVASVEVGGGVCVYVCVCAREHV